VSDEKITVYRNITLEGFIEEFYEHIIKEELGEDVRVSARVFENENEETNPLIEMHCKMSKSHFKNSWDDIVGFSMSNEGSWYD